MKKHLFILCLFLSTTFYCKAQYVNPHIQIKTSGKDISNLDSLEIDVTVTYNQYDSFINDMLQIKNDTIYIQVCALHSLQQAIKYMYFHYTLNPFDTGKYYIKVKGIESRTHGVCKPSTSNTVTDSFHVHLWSDETGIHGSKAPDILFSCSPNPAFNNQLLKLNASTAENAAISIYNMKGQLIKQAWEGRLQSGENNIILSLNDLASGLYLYEIYTADGIQRIKFSKF